MPGTAGTEAGIGRAGMGTVRSGTSSSRPDTGTAKPRTGTAGPCKCAAKPDVHSPRTYKGASYIKKKMF